MGLISSESKAHWEKLQHRRTIKVLTPQDSAMLLLRNQPAKGHRIVSRLPKAKAVPMEKDSSKKLPSLPSVQKVENPQCHGNSKLLGKRPRESNDSVDDLLMKNEDEHLRKRRRLHEDQLRKRRLEEIKSQKEADERKRRKQEDDELNKVKEGKLKKREEQRAALKSVETRAEKDVQDHHKIMKDLAALINYAPDEYNYLYP